MWEIVIRTLQEEYADLGDPAQFTRAFARLALATALGACVGYEREMRGAIAGLRTHMLVALGVALFVVGTVESSVSSADLTRVLQGIIAGIGFVGAAAIIRPRDENQIRGVTTAAGIWATAAIAMAAGLGRETAAILGTVLVVVTLTALRRVESKHDARFPLPPPDDRP